MKNLFRILVLLPILFITSCSEDDGLIYEGAPYATFALDKSRVAVNPTEASFDHEVVASILSPQGSATTLTVSVDQENSTAVEGVDFDIVNTSITVPAGSTNAAFMLKVYSEPAVTLGKSVVLNISSPEIETASFNASHKVTIELACPLPDDFPLEYGIMVQALGSSFPTHLQTITPVAGEDNTFMVESLWGPNFVAEATGNSSYAGQYVYPGKFTINCDNTVDFVGTDANMTGGTGTYDPMTGQITGTLSQSLFTNDFTVDITMIPNQ